MKGILTQRDRINLPFGMTELDLLNYSPILYELYRNEGEGWDKDAFRYDPVVSTGMLASQYELAKGLAWVNYLTPESQGAINPGDNLIVPVQTYDNYRELPPWEKKMTHEVSYTGEKGQSRYSANLLNIQASNVGMKHNFVGDFSYYFDQESRMAGAATAELEPAPVGSTRPFATLVGTPIKAVTDMRPRTELLANPIIDTPITTTIAGPVRPVRPFGPVRPVMISNTPGMVPTTTSSPTAPQINQSALPMGGGGGGVMSSDSGETESTEQEAEGGGGSAQKVVDKPCEMNYMPILIGLGVGLLIAYFAAKHYKKDIKIYGASGAVIGALLGFAYAKHQCKPIEALSRIGIKSDSKYYGGR